MIDLIQIEGRAGITPRETTIKINELIEASNRQDRAISALFRDVQQDDMHKDLSEEDYYYWKELM